ncbi:unnamed protein product [Coregonus sp. 'balchen']|nr:unnamed protein product [Coregonus sp. 'balchen']
MVSLMRTLYDHRYEVYWCALSPTLLATCSWDKTIRIYNRNDFSELLFSPLSGHGYGVHCFSSWHLPVQLLHRRVDYLELVTEVCYRVYTSGDIKVWDLDMKQLHAEKDVHDLGVTCCHFAPEFDIDGTSVQFRLASCGQDSQLKIWIISQHAVRCSCTTVTGQSAPVLSCIFSSDGELLVSGAFSPTLPWMVTGSMDKTLNPGIPHVKMDKAAIVND